VLLQQGATHLLGVTRRTLAASEVFRQRLQGHGTFEGLTHRLMVGKDPGIEGFYGNTQRPWNREAIALLSFVELGDALMSAIRVGHQDKRVEAVAGGVQHRFPGKFEVTAALSREEITARQIVDVEPIKGGVGQNSRDERLQSLRFLLGAAAFV
jgi:hypothetical protein